MPLMKRREFLLAALGLPAYGVAAMAEAGPHYSARLIGGETAMGRWRAGLDITLDRGWKTYWRMPGDAGVPPQFDWSRSRNVESATVLWPAPKRFVDQGGETVGYKDRIVFPVDVVAADPALPIELALDAFLGVCENVCIPVKLDMALAQSDPAPADASLIAAFAARVPRKVDAQSRFRVTGAALAGTGGGYALALRLAGEGFDSGLDIFVEGSDFVYFHGPRPAGEKGLFRLRIDGLEDPKKLHGSALTLTMTAGDIRLEQDVVVD
ncbi:MAG: protein-disulfide reductase DsbD domain-containing protein [Parvibaculaceae bacterium]